MNNHLFTKKLNPVNKADRPLATSGAAESALSVQPLHADMLTACLTKVGLLREHTPPAQSTADVVQTFTVLVIMDDKIRPALRVAAATRTGNVFRFTGGKWDLVYNNESCQMDDCVGLHHLHALIARQGELIHVDDLINNQNGEAVDAIKESDAFALLSADHGEDGNACGYSTVQSNQLICDGASKQEYENLLVELEGMIEAYRSSGQLDELHECEHKAAQIRKTLQKGMFISDGKRRADSVRIAIKRAIKKLWSCHPSLAAHLDRSIKTGRECRYLPESRQVWDVSNVGRVVKRHCDVAL